MDRLSALDSAFLLAEDEDPTVSLAIASVAVLAGPAPSLAELTRLISNRLPLIPRLRQKVRRAPLDLLPPTWIDDPAFDITAHIQRVALPSPGDDNSLRDMVGEVMSQRLDRDRPLWEAWTIEGLPDSRWALLVKVHHCVADGVSASHLYDVLCDGRTSAGPVSPFTAVNGLRSLVRAAAELSSPPVALARALRLPGKVIGSFDSTVQGLASYATSLLPVAHSPLVGPTGRQRTYGMARSSLSTVHAIARAFDVTVNDVVLAVVAGAFRTMMLKRGEQPTSGTVRTLVPVSVRSDGTEHHVSNQISAMLPMLPVEIEDPVRRLTAVHARVSHLKSGNQTATGTAMTSMVRPELFGPVAWLFRLVTHLPQRSVVTVTTNVPGPRRPLTLLGRQIIEIFPYVPIALRLRTGIAVLTYHDQIAFGVTTDRRTTPEADLIATAIEDGISDLAEAAASAR